MSYQVLARKWRPRSFQDMVGQEPILRMLANALEQKRIHHAYLFTGTRGVGKTTLARIFAKCLNCETSITATPCDTCQTCQAIDAGRFLDLFEIDAASRTKVEDTRELLDNVLYPPTQGRYKVYLIDEVHMLSNHSFNALLKTLEEPPAHVKFLLATTDPKRLPITILSRCLQFHLKRMTNEQITQRLQSISQTENISADSTALETLAKAADGSMRDALSLLEQAIAYGSGKVNKEDVHAMLGSIPQESLLPLLEALATHDGNQLLQLITHLAEHAPDFHQLLEELIHLLHQIAIAQIVPEARINEEAITLLAQRFTPEEVQLYYQIALLGRRDLSLTSHSQQGFEMTMLRMLAFKPTLSTQSPKEEKKLNLAPATNIPDPTPVSISPPSTAVMLESVNPIDIPEWRELLPKLELTGMAYALASNCSLLSINHNKVELALAEHHQPMLNAKLKERMTEALTRYFKQPTQLEIKTTTVELLTPIKHQQQEKNQRLADVKQTMLADTQIQKLIEMYDATVEVSLIS